MATIIFTDTQEEVRENFIFRENLDEIHKAIIEFRWRIEKMEYVFIASIVETVVDNFDKNDNEDAVFH